MVNLYEGQWTRSEPLSRYVADMDQIGGIRALTFQDGPEAGSAASSSCTAPLSFTVLADRAMDVGLAEINGVPGLLTAVGYAHPAYFEAPGLNWLRSFQGGLFVTCGLDTAGFLSSDAEAEFGLGRPRAALRPAAFARSPIGTATTISSESAGGCARWRSTARTSSSPARSPPASARTASPSTTWSRT